MLYFFSTVLFEGGQCGLEPFWTCIALVGRLWKAWIPYHCLRQAGGAFLKALYTKRMGLKLQSDCHYAFQPHSGIFHFLNTACACCGDC